MKKPVNVTLDAELWKRFRIRAIEDGTSGSAVLDSLIRAYLGESSYPQEAASLLKVSERTLRRLKLPRVKFGKQYRYRQSHIDGFINLHIEYPETVARHVSRMQKRSRKVGLSVLPSRAMLHATRLGFKTEAKKAEREARAEAEKRPALQPTAMATASGAYLIASAERGRSR